jgi:C-terminal processing protease CtpA/Prc
VQAQHTKIPPTVNTQRIVEEIDGLIHKNGLYKDSLDWQLLYRQINTIAFTERDTTNRRLILNVFTENLRKAGDKHSFFITTDAAKSFRKRERTAAKPTAKYLESGIALVRIPYCFNNHQSKDIDFANTIRQQIKRVDTKHKVAVWIVDLRNNTGGNMWPMLAGLNALVKDGTAGYFINPASKFEQPWLSYNGKLVLPRADIDNYKVRFPGIKIAVLIDSMTASSGEMTAISFIGLPNVKVFGQPSAGYTTANSTYYLSDGTMFNLATSYVADRTKKAYLDKIIPDTRLKNTGDSGIKEAVELIRNWLVQRGK